jgi:hypothetical protein
MKHTLFFIFLLLSFTGFSQTSDSLFNEESNTDTVFVYEEPVMVNKTIYVQIPAEIKNRKYYLTLLSTLSTGTNFYDVCPDKDCIKHLENIKSTTTTYINNSVGVSFSYSPKKVYTELGISYATYRDKFMYTDSFSITLNKINIYRYLELNLTSGYWLYRAKHKISFLLKGGISVGKLLQSSGYTLSKVNTGKVIGLTDEMHYYDYTYRLIADMASLYKLSDKIYAQVGFSYAYDLRSITKSKDLYTRQRNVFGLSLGLKYNF